jgi:C4-dicarboxylate-specific signal transduction histidine kinase
MTYLATALAGFAVLMFLGIGMRVVWNVELENRMDEAEIESSRRYQEMMGDRVEQVRRYRHDADALLRAIERASEFGAGRFPLSHAAIELQRNRCGDVGIPFRADIGIAAEALVDSGISDSDLCLVLQNLLDNAYEASCATERDGAPAAERAISLKIGQDTSRGVFVEVSNRTGTDELPTFETGKANPEYHGVGLQVVNDIPSKYGGAVRPAYDSATQTVTMAVELHS